jgi:hypothetical protein
MRIEMRPGQGPIRAALPRVRLAEIAWREHAWVAVLLAVLVAGGWLRLSGANWDESTHLHPDERYIASIANLIHFPSSPVTYFDVKHSPLSPYNDTGDHSYSYGTLPLFGTKAVADVIGQGDYDHLYLVGRRLSGLLDCGTAVLVFLITRTLLAGFGARSALRGGLLAAALYAFTVAAVQASHFFTTDTWLVFFGTLTFYLALRALLAAGRSDRKTVGLLVLVGACTGLSLACKASGLFVILPVLLALLGRAAFAPRVRAAALSLVGEGLLVLLCAYLAFRLVSPYSFASSNWLDLTLGHDYRNALQTQRDILDGKAVFPPTLQWLVSPRLTDPFKNLVTWQLGIPLGVCAVAGTILLAVQAVRRAVASAVSARGSVRPARESVLTLTLHLMVLAYVLGVFLYVATRFQHMGRYLLPILPFLAIIAGYAVVMLSARREWLFASAAVLVVALTGAYALAFHAIYTSKTTRLAANDWIARHIPSRSTIASENWDDTLPVGSGLAVSYRQVIVPVFDPDDRIKLRNLYTQLSPADYYALSSQRAWKTIGRLPDRYPLMVRYYKQLFAGRLGFALVKSITSEPRLFGFHLDDLGAEEAFSVYDHPPVEIFRHRTHLTFTEFRHALCTPPVPSACG